MKKPITIGVIAVIATILVTSAVDFSVDAKQPNEQIRLQTSGSENAGLISCPNGDTFQTGINIIHFTEHEGFDERGDLRFEENPGRKSFQASLWSGKIQADRFAFTGVAFTNTDLAQFCGTDSGEVFEMRIWGKCGQDVTVHFESDLGYSGSFIGNLLCV